MSPWGPEGPLAPLGPDGPVSPCAPEGPLAPLGPDGPDAFQETGTSVRWHALKSLTMRSAPVVYDLCMKFYADPVRTPIEDASVEWTTELVPVARLARMSGVRSAGTRTSSGTSTCWVKKYGRLRANAVCTLYAH